MGKETKVSYCKFDVTFGEKEYDMLRDYGLKEIQKDPDSLVNYAVNKVLENHVKENKNESKNSRKTHSKK